MEKDPFKEYIRQSEPGVRDKGYVWYTAIGLQAVDGLTPSKYLVETAIKNIEGNITIDQAQQLLDRYYEENPKEVIGDRTEEADNIGSCFKESTGMPDECGIIILPKKNGCLMGRQYCTEALQNCRRL